MGRPGGIIVLGTFYAFILLQFHIIIELYNNSEQATLQQILATEK